MRLRYIAENDTQGAMIKFSAGSPPLVMGRRRRTITRRGVRHLWASIFGCGSQAAARGLAHGSRSGRRKDAAKGRAFHVARRAACGGRSEAQRVGKEGIRTGISRGSALHIKKQIKSASNASRVQ